MPIQKPGFQNLYNLPVYIVDSLIFWLACVCVNFLISQTFVSITRLSYRKKSKLSIDMRPLSKKIWCTCKQFSVTRSSSKDERKWHLVSKVCKIDRFLINQTVSLSTDEIELDPRRFVRRRVYSFYLHFRPVQLETHRKIPRRIVLCFWLRNVND